jgi:hypothetical protein
MKDPIIWPLLEREHYGEEEPAPACYNDARVYQPGLNRRQSSNQANPGSQIKKRPADQPA